MKLVEELEGKCEELFTEQVGNLVKAGCHEATEMSEKAFRKLLEPLRGVVVSGCVKTGLPLDYSVPFLIVMPASLIGVEKQISLFHLGLPDYLSTEDPVYGRYAFETCAGNRHSLPYAIIDIELDTKNSGESTAVYDYFIEIEKRSRKSLNLEEGLALCAHFPENIFTKERKDICLLGSLVHRDNSYGPIVYPLLKEDDGRIIYDVNSHGIYFIYQQSGLATFSQYIFL